MSESVEFNTPADMVCSFRRWI